MKQERSGVWSLKEWQLLFPPLTSGNLLGMLLSNVIAPQIVTTAAQIPTLVSSFQAETHRTSAGEALAKFLRNKELFSQNWLKFHLNLSLSASFVLLPAATHSGSRPSRSIMGLQQPDSCCLVSLPAPDDKRSLISFISPFFPSFSSLSMQPQRASPVS